MKQMLRALNGSIRNLVDAEQVRHETALTVIHKKHGRGGLNNLARAWAAGGSSGSTTSSSSKSVEQIAAEDREATVSTHRESVLWFLRQRLQECVEAQQNMMEIRIAREMEKNRSVLAKAQARAPPGLIAPPPLEGNGTAAAVADHGKMKAGVALSSKQHAVAQDEASSSSASYNPVEGLTQEQVQMFEQDNKEMLRHYESTLDQVRWVQAQRTRSQIPIPIPIPGMFFTRSSFYIFTDKAFSTCRTAQKSLIEISELQTQLVGNLATQSAHIDQLVADSMNTTENVGGGNKQLKQATQKPSTAKYTFFATCGLCAFLIVWDLVI